MRRINKSKFFAVLAVWAIALAVLTYFLKQQMGISNESFVSPLISFATTGIGVMIGITILKGMVARGKARWLEEHDG